MAKAPNKGKKLDLIVTEIAKLKKLLKTLAAQQADLAGQLGKLTRGISNRPSKTPARKSSATIVPPAAAAKSKRPVSVKAVEGPQATSRVAS